MKYATVCKCGATIIIEMAPKKKADDETITVKCFKCGKPVMLNAPDTKDN